MQIPMGHCLHKSISVVSLRACFPFQNKWVVALCNCHGGSNSVRLSLAVIHHIYTTHFPVHQVTNHILSDGNLQVYITKSMGILQYQIPLISTVLWGRLWGLKPFLFFIFLKIFHWKWTHFTSPYSQSFCIYLALNISGAICKMLELHCQ